MRDMKKVFSILLIALVSIPALAHDRVQITALEKRIKELEERVALLDASTAPAVAKATTEQKAQAQRNKARERMRKDSSVYSRDERKEIESLYQVANKKWQSQEGKDSLKQLVEKYDKANRTGCALLYLGQMSKGQEREDFLKQAIEGFSDCFYGDGVQVGAYAPWYLAHHHKETGDADRARELFREIKSQFPDAIDHRGRQLADFIKD